ncbi:MAG TPA: ABC transporter permease [Candidatus Eisenbacteria bacterium]|nr:ABC transporter permease [Candidatus Eisenbacteria bacterium]
MTNTRLYWGSFRGLLLRDISVLRREVIPFLIRTVMNPLMFVFVFTYLFPRMGQGFQSNAGASFGTLILPGLLAVGIFIQGIMATALPLSMEIGATREIHDRVMSPLPVTWVAIEKIVFSAVQSLLAALVIFPLVYFIPATPVQVHVSSWGTLIGILVLASLVAGTVGLAIGTVVKPEQIALMFGIIVVPVTFFGCVYYPWAAMHNVRWLQILVLINPLVYMSEGLRTALTPMVPHMPAWVAFVALLIGLAVLGTFGVRGFIKRVLT